MDSFHAREHAIALIRQGDFAGAYGAVKHLENDQDENIWVKKVKDVSDYFGGQLEEDRVNLTVYLEDFTNEVPRCLLVAMRAETALLSNRIADAISLTCTFWDAAILDAIERNQQVEINEVENRIIYPADYAVAPKLTKGNRPCLKNEFPEKGHYYYNVMYLCFKFWFKIIGENVKHLEIYRDALYNEISIEPIPKDGSKKLIPRNLRNVNTHSLVKSEQLAIAEKVFVKAGFWATDAKPIAAGSCFLAQDLVDNVLKELGQTNVSQRYAQLIKGVCGELAKPATIKVN